MVDWYGLGWFILSLAALIFLQRRLHFEIQAIFLLLFGRPEIALVLFSLLLFPGVLLHEVSHYFMAGLLNVPIGRFSLWPQPMPDGRLQLGFVETATADWLRDALIGIAPLLTGGAFVAYAGQRQLGLLTVWDMLVADGAQHFLGALAGLHNRPDFYLWFYLAFAISSTMLPSASDRRSWLPIIIAIALLVGVALIAGAGPWLLVNLSPLLNRFSRTLAVVFSLSAAIHLIALLPLRAARGLIARLSGRQLA